MHKKELSRYRIEQIREVANGARSPYLLRTRLNRMLLSLQRSIAKDHDLEILSPGQLVLSGEHDNRQRQIVEICNAILLESLHLSQRSESMDERWEINWKKLDSRLAELELLLSN